MYYMIRILDNRSLDKSASIIQFKLIIRLRKTVHSGLHF